uniref:Salivary protein n=1 Tax=Ixodes sinensis TaxID=339422 RepID=I4IY13_IXOSI|nr:salp15 Is-2 [Ixodes sinensis]CCI50997.1 salivary protein [Ixodes sinensis]
MESFVAMKVVCIILLFVIVAANLSAANNTDSSKDGKDTNGENVKLKFPSFIHNPKKLAMELLDICKKNKTPPSSYNVINDKHVDFKNCTFLCKHGQHENVTLDLPKETPCGPSGQTCADKSKCVGHIPGC